MEEEYLQAVKRTPGIEQSAGIIMDAIVARTKTERNRIFLGVDEDFLKLRKNWRFKEGGWFERADSIIIGSSVAEDEGLKVGDKYHVAEKRGNFTVNADLVVSGVLEPTNTQDDGFYFMPTKTLQKEFNLEDKLVVILVKVKDVTKVDDVTAALRESESSMNVFPLTELLNTMGRMIGNTKVFVMAIVLVAIAIGAVGVLNTILMTVFERTKEIGMMKAVGASKLDVFRLIWLETLVMCTVGGLVGVGLSLVTSRGVEAFIKGVLGSTGLISVPKGTLIAFNSDVFFITMALSIVLGLAAGAYPAWRASSIKPIEAIRAD
jgi:putative ABC transport system permease protein